MEQYNKYNNGEYESLYSELVPLQKENRRRSNTGSKIGGLGIMSTTLFIAGEMAGSGVLALPRAIVDSGFIGLVLLIVFCFNAAYGGVRLGNCWAIVEERFPEHRKSTRNPYAIIAQKAVGSWGSIVVSYCIKITLFGAGTVYLLLAAEIIQELLISIIPAMSSCSYFIIISICLIPPMWLGSPKEFSLVGMGAILTTVMACILIFVQILIDGQNSNFKVEHKIHGFHDFFLAFGTLLFAFGGASTFPTIQNDMEDKNQFTKSVSIAFFIILLLYLPVSAGGYFVYGELVGSNIILSLSKTSLVFASNILMAAHLIFAFLIVVNPVCQEFEETFKIPKYFNWKRCLLRTLIVVIMIAIGESIPQFGKILSLIGGSTITLLTFVFPPYFYMKLCAKISDDWELRHIPLHEKIYMWELIFIGLIGGCASTYSAIIAIFGHDYFTKPCYWLR